MNQSRMVPGWLLYDRCDGETNHQEVAVGFLVVTKSSEFSPGWCPWIFWICKVMRACRWLWPLCRHRTFKSRVAVCNSAVLSATNQDLVTKLRETAKACGAHHFVQQLVLCNRKLMQKLSLDVTIVYFCSNFCQTQIP